MLILLLVLLNNSFQLLSSKLGFMLQSDQTAHSPWNNHLCRIQTHSSKSVMFFFQSELVVGNSVQNFVSESVLQFINTHECVQMIMGSYLSKVIWVIVNVDEKLL